MASFKAQVKAAIKKQDTNVRAEMRLAFDTFALIVFDKLNDVTKRWSSGSRPRFVKKVAYGKTSWKVEFSPQGAGARIWKYVDEGTRPHIIRAKIAPMLRFQTGYRPKTAPVARYNVGPGRAFGEWRSAKAVRHPGTKARKFSVVIPTAIRPTLDKRLQAAIVRGLAKST